MFTAWRLENFKSVRGPVELALAPLTCLTGANSSGKSTVLQSMLMLAQTTRYSPPWVPLELHGPMVSLGTLTDVRTSGVSADAPVRVGFSFVRGEVGRRSQVRCDLSFDDLDEYGTRDPDSPSLVRADFDVSVQLGDGLIDYQTIVGRVDPSVFVSRLGRSMTVFGGREFAHVHRYDQHIRGPIPDAPQTFEGCSLRHFLPELSVHGDGANAFVARPLGPNQLLQTLVGPTLTELRAIRAERGDAQLLHPRVGTASPDDVGLHGELYASVLHDRARTVCSVLPPERFFLRGRGATTPPPTAMLFTETLHEVVTKWLHYLGVADALSVNDLGRLGHEVKVTAPGESKARYLTELGSGVAQVLPVVVMCLASQTGATLLIELPELHLHPAVQAKLGDFFLAIALSGRQVIVETHSEYLINRLRYRVAGAAGDSLLPVVQIHFAEKKDGASTFRPLVLDRYGGIVDWPDGFFDDSQIEIEQILLAGADKMEADADRLDAAAREGGDASGG